MPFSFNVKEQIIIGIAVTILVFVVFAVFVFKPQYDKFSDSRSRQEQELQQQQSKQAELDNLKVAKKEAALTEAKSLSLNKQMPEETDLPSVLVELDNLGQETDVKVLDITPSPIVPASGYSNLPVDLNVVGSYFNITDFLYKLVRLPREYTVGDVSLEIAEEGYPFLSANIKTTTYLYSPNATPTSAAAGGNSDSTSTSQKTGTQ